MYILSLLVAGTVALQGPSILPDSLDRAAAYRLARERSPVVEAAKAAIRGADAELASARAERGPRLAADLLYLRYQDPPAVAFGAPVGFAPLLRDNLAVGLRVGQPVYTGGRIGAAIRAAEAGREATTNRARAVVAEVDGTVSKAFDDVLLARALVDVAEEGVSVLEEAVRVAREQVESGAVARIDVLRAETRLSSARADRTAARDRVSDARERLAAVLGLDEPSLPAVSGELMAVEGNSVAELRESAGRLGEHGALLAVAAAARAREAEARLARGARLPSVSLQLGALSTRPELMTGRKEWGEELYAAVGLTWTFFDFGRSSSRASTSTAAAERLRARGSALEDSLRAVVRVEIRRLERSVQEVEDARSNVRRAEQVLDLARERYREGIGIQLEVLEAQAEMARVRGDLHRAAHASRTAVTEARRALGRTVLEYPLEDTEGGEP